MSKGIVLVMGTVVVMPAQAIAPAKVAKGVVKVMRGDRKSIPVREKL